MQKRTHVADTQLSAFLQSELLDAMCSMLEKYKITSVSEANFCLFLNLNNFNLNTIFISIVFKSHVRSEKPSSHT